MIAAEQEVLASQSQRSDCIFHEIIIYLISGVSHVSAEPWQKRNSITYRLTLPAVFSPIGCGVVHPFLEGAYGRVGYLFPHFLQLFRTPALFLRITLYIVQFPDQL